MSENLFNEANGRREVKDKKINGFHEESTKSILIDSYCASSSMKLLQLEKCRTFEEMDIKK